MEGEEERSENEGSFSKASIPKRIAIVIAGATVNIIFGLLVYFVLMSTSTTYVTNEISSVLDGYVAQEVGLQQNDKIVELDGKKINGTTVIIEYEIKVTNIGEVDGYVRKIVDYMPSDLKFSSELNKDWYQTGTDLYNTSLANEKITAGQSKSVKLTLTKAMTENNTGLINNTAEIAESYNELGIADSKSTPGNRVNGESDYGSADAILSLKTGGEVYIAITIIAIIALGIPTFIIIRKKYIKGDRK